MYIMIKYVIWILMIFINSLEIVNAQEPGGKQNHWKLGGAIGMDFAQMLFVNPKFGAGEDKIGIGGNLSFFAKYKQNRLSWDNFLGLTFGVQRLGSFRRQIPFQKSVDELRLTSKFGYSITDQSPFGYAFDVLGECTNAHPEHSHFQFQQCGRYQVMHQMDLQTLRRVAD